MRRQDVATLPTSAPVPWHVDVEAASPAETVLWLCGRRSLSADEQERLREVTTRWDAATWRALYAVADVQGMAPLVLAHIAQAGLLPAIPPAVAEDLLAAYRATWIHNRELRGEQGTIVAALAARGIEVMLVKGVELAARYYGELALRPVSDIDLLVRRDDAEECGAVLQELGYHPVLGKGDPLSFNPLMYRALTYRKAPRFVVEVHWELSSLPTYLPRFSVDDVWRRAERVEVSGHTVRYLAAADELRYLSFHYAAQHQGSRLIWLVDIAQLVRTLGPDWNWPGFIRETVALGLATPVAAALGRARRVLGLELPAGVLAQLQQAAAQPQERAAWYAALASFHQLGTAWRYVLAQRRPAERIAFLRAGLTRARRRWTRGARALVRGDIRRLPAERSQAVGEGIPLRVLLDAAAGNQAESVSALYYAACARSTVGYRLAKRVLDVCLSLLALLLLAPAMLLIALLIKLGDGGPVLYRREMVGESEVLFRMYKFRTMKVHAERLLAADRALYERYRSQSYKLRDDPRVTGVGRFLRRHSLDELPQFWNIVRGEMSLVGPRCIHPSELSLYGEYAWVRHCVRPGLTGLWQISGRSERTYRERVWLDLEYVLTCSLRGDVAIMARTVPVVLRGAGAY